MEHNINEWRKDSASVLVYARNAAEASLKAPKSAEIGMSRRFTPSDITSGKVPSRYVAYKIDELFDLETRWF